MSEFKFACPVCGQHMMCDVSQGGSVMECPTCFQKIVAPQAPAPDTKFILTGTKLSQKKTRVGDADTSMASQKKKSPAVLILIIAALILALGAGAFFLGGKLFGRHYDWKSADIGNIRMPGTFSQSGGALTIAGSGSDIWNQADAFHFVYLPMNGDGVITARVMSLQNTHAWAKAGVMFRDSLNADSKYALVFESPSSNVAFQQRSRTGGQAAAVASTAGKNVPYWVRLARQGDKFLAYSSADGKTWAEMGSARISMSREIFAGLAVSAHNSGTLCQAQFDHVDLQGGTATGPETGDSPDE